MFALPVYSKSLGASALAIGGLFSIFTVTTLLLRPVVGWALDRFGRKCFFITALIGHAMAMGLFALSGTVAGLYVARLVQGIGASFFWISINTIIADLTSPKNRGKTMGSAQERAARGQVFGAIAGFTLLGFLPKDIAWRWVFSGYAVMAGAGAWLAWKKVPETRYEVSSGVKQKLVLSGQLLKLMAIVFTTGVSAAMISPIYMIFLQDKFTTNVSILALAFLPSGFVYSFLPSRLGGLSDCFGRASMMAVGLVGAGVLSLLLPHLPNMLWLIVLYTLSAVGWSVADPAETAMVADITGSKGKGIGYGVYSFADNLGRTFGPLLGGWLYDTIGQTVPFYLNGAILLASAGWVLLLLRQSISEDYITG